MFKGFLNLKIDFTFKNTFGKEKNSKILISFLNSVLRLEYPITSVDIKKLDLGKNFIEDKFSRFDVKVTTSKEEIRKVN